MQTLFQAIEQVTSHPKKRLSLFFLLAVLGNAFPLGILLFHLPEITTNDWRYFNSLSALVRSLAFYYQNLSFHDPWMCGGLDILANPQNRIFSPFGLLDWIIIPQWANMITTLITFALGFEGMFRFLKRETLPSTAAFLGAFLFVHSSWFALHRVEGHIPFHTFALLPWIGIWIQDLSKKSILFICLTFTVLVLDGGFYPLIFCIYWILSLMLVGIVPIREFAAKLWKARIVFLIGVGLFLLTTSIKLAPVLKDLAGAPPSREFFSVPLSGLGKILFWPFQRRTFGIEGSPLGFHEFSFYLGLVATGLLFWGVWTQRWLSNRRQRAWILSGLLFFWVGVGWLDPVNPWRAFVEVPLLNHVHIQSRFLVLALPAIVLFVCLAWNQLSRGRFKNTLFVFLIFEAWLVSNYPFENWLRQKDARTPTSQHIEASAWGGTVGYGNKPFHYYRGEQTGFGSKECYEPARGFRTQVRVQAEHQKFSIASFEPGRLSIQPKSSVPVGTEFTINTNDLGAWREANGLAEVISKKGDLLRVRLLEPATTETSLVLEHRPHNLGILIALWAMGSLGWIFVGWQVFRNKSTWLSE